MAADAFEGLPVRSAATLGNLTDFERMALAVRAKHGTHVGWERRLGLTPAEVEALYYDAQAHLRPVQRLPSSGWRTAFMCMGRGSGKTHAGSAAILGECMADAEAKVVLVAPTYKLAESTNVLGPSGILALCPPWFRPQVKKGNSQLLFPNGAEVTWMHAQKADHFRGKAASLLVADEVVAWDKDPEEVYRECRAILRHQTRRMKALGMPARMIITTTPAPLPIFRRILEDRDGLIIACSTTMENASGGLDPSYVAMARRMAATVEGRREFLGELSFGDMDARVFARVDFNATRVATAPEQFDTILIGVDPATGEKKGADATGVVVIGLRKEEDGCVHAYVLADLSGRYPVASDWARKVVAAYHAWKPLAKAIRIVAESNTGGNLVKDCIRQADRNVSITTHRARNSKVERAIPVASLWEAGLVHFVGHNCRDLEKQLGGFTGAAGGHARDDRVDALCLPLWLYQVPHRQNRGVLGTDPE